MPHKAFYILFLVLLSTASAWAYDNKPPEIKSHIHARAPYGTGTYSFFFKDLYQASLWTDAPEWSWHTPFALTLRYDISASSEKLTSRSLDEMDAQSPLSSKEQEIYATALARIFPDVKPGDQITAFYKPGKALHFFYNTKPIGVIKDAELSKRFLSIWLSEQTSAPDLRRQLLASSNSSNER